MKLSQPVDYLKRKARLLSRQERIPLHAALDRIAAEEGFRSWGLLMARAPSIAGELYSRLETGDLVLLGARPGLGKTLMGLKLAVEAVRSGRRSVFFTLEYAEKDVLGRLRAIGIDRRQLGASFDYDCSDAINADYIATTLAAAPGGTLAVIDYLQLLDQRRENPDLNSQVQVLKAFAQRQGVVLVFLSQIDRRFEALGKELPDLSDIRLPNALDLSLFSKACFMNGAEYSFQALQ
ncbi:DNA helicase [Bosea caraganae]|uniref:DNA helicase n=1 Tax=Bosea caraganae TaxID=2763117 RepID=A0A370L0Q5_9HYPH|nr:DNA helicase [Bosea caraganae]RDJ20978.1 DNA helicase [Bosea caraganae]RDJ28477.1 DNA helicase [Bosea caraganae]